MTNFTNCRKLFTLCSKPGESCTTSFQLVLLTSEAHEQAEEDRVEEAKANGKNIFMNHRRHGEHKKHGGCTESHPRHLE